MNDNDKKGIPQDKSLEDSHEIRKRLFTSNIYLYAIQSNLMGLRSYVKMVSTDGRFTVPT